MAAHKSNLNVINSDTHAESAVYIYLYTTQEVFRLQVNFVIPQIQ